MKASIHDTPINVLHDAEHWRSRARRTRADATFMKDDAAKAILLEIAWGYVSIAELLESRPTQVGVQEVE